MIYSEDITEQGKKCEIVVKGETLACIVICAFERTTSNKQVIKKYRLESKDKTIYDNVNPTDIKFKK
jgi:hypothetical protein